MSLLFKLYPKILFLLNDLILPFLLGIEDELNWHGKALGAKAEAALEAIGAKIVNKGPHELKAELPVNNAPVVDLSNIKLNTPPAYTMGELVSWVFSFYIYLVCL